MERSNGPGGSVLDNEDEVLERVARVMATVFSPPDGTAITRATSSADIEGWDSLSHSIFILGVEDEFGMDLPIDKTYEMKDVGDLVDLIVQQSGKTPQ